MEKNLGHATAYGYAKSKGYSGTEEEFAELMADYASVGQSAAQSAEQAAASATSATGSATTASQAAQTATSKASEAVTAADTATTKASEASTSADTASTAAQTATDKASIATTAASTATTKASEAAVSATTASTAKTNAETARDAAAQSASEAAESARTLTIDDTLTQSGQASDAKATGDAITELKSDLSDTKTDLSKINTDTVNKFVGDVSAVEGQSISAYDTIIECYIPANMPFQFICNSTATISGNKINVYFRHADGSSATATAINIGETVYLTRDYDIAGVSIYLSDSSITASGEISLDVEYLSENPNSTETYIEKTKKAVSPFVQATQTPNIFTWWKEGYLSENANGRTIVSSAKQLCSVGFIPVKPSTEYMVIDPEAISVNARNAQYAWEYDENFDFIRKISASSGAITTGDTTRYIRLSSQTVGTQSYVIGDYANFKTMVVEGYDYFAEYIPNADVASNIDVDNTKYPMVGGIGSNNVFRGGSFLCGGLNYSTGRINTGSNVLCTPLIPVSGDLYWYLIGGKLQDVRFIFEYDESGAFVKYTVADGIYGHVVLDNTTKYVRMRSQTNGSSNGYVITTAEFIDSHLIASMSPIMYYHDYSPVADRKSVSDDFADSAVYLNEFNGEKALVDNYVSTIEESAYDVVIPIITDVHSEMTTPYDLHNYLASAGFANVLFNLGDSIPNYYATKAEAVKTLKMVFHEEYLNPKKGEVYVLCGNHDYNPVDNNAVANTINQKLYYSLSQARLKKGYAGVGKNYGYIDLEDAKVRLIWLDSGDIFDSTTGEPLTTGMNTIVQQEQFTWFCNVALDFIDKENRAEWAVVTLSHDALSSLSDGGFATVIKAFMDGTTAHGTAYCVGRGSTIPQEYDVDFTEQGPMEYICHLNGHYHEDNVVELGNTGRKQIYIACDNRTAYHYVNGERVAYTRTAGTIEMHCIDAFCLDRKNKTITMKRLGIGSDRTITY